MERESALLRIPAFDHERDRPLLAHATRRCDALGRDFAAELWEELCSWEGTPHRAGQARKGRDGGVDCTHFAAAALEWAYRCAGLASSLRDVGPLPRSAQDLGVHRDCLGAVDEPHSGAAWWFARRFPLRVISDVDHSASLDLVVMAVAGGANHLGIVGDRRPTARGAVRGGLWHASGGAGGAVCRASLADAAMRRRIRFVFRPCITGGSPA